MISFLFLFLTSTEIRVQSPQGPVPNHEIQIIGFSEGNASLVKNLKTNSQGAASFATPKQSSGGFAVQTLFQEVPYYSDLFDASVKNVTLQVYPTSDSKDDLVIEDVRIYFEQTPEGIHVDQDFVIYNPSKSTRVGKIFDFDVPGSAYDFKFGMGFSERNTEIEGNHVHFKDPIAPGKTRLAVAYNLEPSRGRINISQKLSLPVQNLSVGLDGPKLRVNSSSTPVSKVMDGRLVQVIEMKPKSPTELELTISGIPLQIRVHHWLPFAVLGVFLLIGLLSKKKKSSGQPSESSHDALMLELANWQRLRDAGGLSDREYQLRRLESLEKLIANDQG